MDWYKEFYAGEAVAAKKQKIKWKIMHNAGQLDIYVIAAGTNPANLLDIISACELMQKHYPKDELLVVGIDKGYDNACELAGRIIMDVYRHTGDFKIRSYFLERQKELSSGNRRPVWRY